MLPEVMLLNCLFPSVTVWTIHICLIIAVFLHVIFKLQVAAYDTKVNKMAFFDPTRAKDFLFISGTKVFDSLSFNQMLQVPQP